MTELSLVSPRVERRLMAVLAADVAGYSRLVGADEEGTLAQWKAHWRELIAPKIAEHRGRIVRIAGDGLLVEFASSSAWRSMAAAGSSRRDKERPPGC